MPFAISERHSQSKHL